MSQRVTTAYGPGVIVAQETVRGRTSYQVQGDQFCVWLEANSIPEFGFLNWEENPHELQDNSTTLPYNPEPQFYQHSGDSTIQPNHHLDTDKRLHPADSVSYQERATDSRARLDHLFASRTAASGGFTGRWNKETGSVWVSEGNYMDSSEGVRRIPLGNDIFDLNDALAVFALAGYTRTSDLGPTPGTPQIYSCELSDGVTARTAREFSPDMSLDELIELDREENERRFDPVEFSPDMSLDELLELERREEEERWASKTAAEMEYSTCPECDSNDIYIAASPETNPLTGINRYRCNDCSSRFDRTNYDELYGLFHTSSVSDFRTATADETAEAREPGERLDVTDQDDPIIGPGYPGGTNVPSDHSVPDNFALGSMADVQARLGDKYIDIPLDIDRSSLQARLDDDPVRVVSDIKMRNFEVRKTLDPRIGQALDLEEADSSIRTAAWADVRAKASRIRSSGGVQLEAANPTAIVATVTGDHGIYEVAVLRGSALTGNSSVSEWSCSCPWGDWAFEREHTYVGRLCSHAYAALQELRSLTMRKDKPRDWSHKATRHQEPNGELATKPGTLTPDLMYVPQTHERRRLDVTDDKNTGNWRTYSRYSREDWNAYIAANPEGTVEAFLSEPFEGSGSNQPDGYESSESYVDSHELQHRQSIDGPEQNPAVRNDSDVVANVREGALDYLMEGSESSDTGEIADAAASFLQRTAGRNFSLAEQQELMDEEAVGGPIEASDFDLRGTHYL